MQEEQVFSVAICNEQREASSVRVVDPQDVEKEDRLAG